MQYRKFIDKDVSILGMGTMRLPSTKDGEIDEDEAIKIIRNAIDNGVNYVDTAWMYHGGKSEIVTGKALKNGYREKVFLADKMPIWLAKDEAHMKELFYTQLERCDTEYFDMYLVHNITKPIWKRAKKLNCLPFLEEMKEQGKIKHIGFSFHDDEDFFEEVVDAYPWEFCQIQLNYMDADFQAGIKGLKYASGKGLPIIVMEPLKGGKLTDTMPPSIEKYWKELPIKKSPADWAFRWVANFPEVSLILSGINSTSQLEENIEILNDAMPDSLTKEELAVIEKVADHYNSLIKFSCTSCKYCMPCPEQIDIPTVINFYNEWFLYGKNEKIHSDFQVWVPEKNRPSKCTQCKACESHCPQALPVSQIMSLAQEIFE